MQGRDMPTFAATACSQPGNAHNPGIDMRGFSTAFLIPDATAFVMIYVFSAE
jgi:hypothetical protein